MHGGERRQISKTRGQRAGVEGAPERGSTRAWLTRACVCEGRKVRLGTLLPREAGRTVLGAYTGLKIACVYTSWGGKTLGYTGHRIPRAFSA